MTMVAILGTMCAMLAGLYSIQEGVSEGTTSGRYLPCPKTEPSRYAYEKFVSVYTPIWMGLFGIVVVFQLYEDFTAMSYLQVCGGLSLPFLLQPMLYPSGGFASPDVKRPLLERYCFKANVWIAVYSFIGNYWYTHCKYPILLFLICVAPSKTVNLIPLFHPPLLQIFIPSSRRNIPCLRIDSTMYQSPCSLPRTFTFLPTIYFPTFCCERL